jgi:hypothetical protein
MQHPATSYFICTMLNEISRSVWKYKFIPFQLGASRLEFKKMRIEFIEMISKPRKNGIISSFLSNFYK